MNEENHVPGPVYQGVPETSQIVKPNLARTPDSYVAQFLVFRYSVLRSTWWLIPLSKWVITPVTNGISRVNPLIIGGITHLLSGMSHQVPPK